MKTKLLLDSLCKPIIYLLVSRMSESFTDTSYNRRTSSSYSVSDGTQTTCTSDDQSDHDNAKYTVLFLDKYFS